MTERRLPPALEPNVVSQFDIDADDERLFIPVDDLLDWRDGLVGRVQVRAADLFAGWKDRGEEDISLAWGLALRVELEGSYIEALRAELGEES